MDSIERILIPTISRAKIANTLSYPVGAERISVALASAPEIADLNLHFCFWSDHGLRRGCYEFIRVEYLNNVIPQTEWPILNLYPRSPHYRWEIVVQPVPRINRHRINKYILDYALPQICHWLVERGGFEQRGNDILAFFYDEKTEEFMVKQLTHLEPPQR